MNHGLRQLQEQRAHANSPGTFPNQVAVITGAADGIGLAAAQAFSSRGMRVCLVDIGGEKLASAEAALPGTMTIVADVSRLEDIEAVKNRVYQTWGEWMF